ASACGIALVNLAGSSVLTGREGKATVILSGGLAEGPGISGSGAVADGPGVSMINPTFPSVLTGEESQATVILNDSLAARPNKAGSKAVAGGRVIGMDDADPVILAERGGEAAIPHSGNLAKRPFISSSGAVAV